MLKSTKSLILIGFKTDTLNPLSVVSFPLCAILSDTEQEMVHKHLTAGCHGRQFSPRSMFSVVSCLPGAKTPRALCWYSPGPHRTHWAVPGKIIFCCFHSVTSTHVNRVFFYCWHSKQEILDGLLIKLISLRWSLVSDIACLRKETESSSGWRAGSASLPERVLHCQHCPACCLGSACSCLGASHLQLIFSNLQCISCCPLCDTGCYRQSFQLAAYAELCILPAI